MVLESKHTEYLLQSFKNLRLPPPANNLINKVLRPLQNSVHILKYGRIAPESLRKSNRKKDIMLGRYP